MTELPSIGSTTSLHQLLLIITNRLFPIIVSVSWLFLVLYTSSLYPFPSSSNTMTDGLGLSELEWQPSGNSSSTHDSQTSTDSVGSKPKKSGGGIFGSMSRKIKGIRSTSTSKPAVTRSASSSQRPLPPFSLKQFSSLKKRHGNPCDVSRKAATVRCHGTDRAAVNNIPRRISMGAGAPIKAPQLEIPKDIGGDFTLGDGA